MPTAYASALATLTDSKFRIRALQKPPESNRCYASDRDKDQWAGDGYACRCPKKRLVRTALAEW